MEDQIVLSPSTENVRVARRFVLDMLVRSRLTLDPDVAVLLVSELAGNAILHAQTEVSVTVHASPDGLTIEVADDSDRVPVLRHATGLATGGRGVSLVAELSDEWGVRPIPGDGKVVWCRLISND